jgi:hypothetical protein
MRPRGRRWLIRRSAATPTRLVGWWDLPASLSLGEKCPDDSASRVCVPIGLVWSYAIRSARGYSIHTHTLSLSQPRADRPPGSTGESVAERMRGPGVSRIPARAGARARRRASPQPVRGCNTPLLYLHPSTPARPQRAPTRAAVAPRAPPRPPTPRNPPPPLPPGGEAARSTPPRRRSLARGRGHVAIAVAIARHVLRPRVGALERGRLLRRGQPGVGPPRLVRPELDLSD